MYLEYFGFLEPPFSIAPNPRYLFMSEKHREGLAHLLYGLSNDCGFVLLTGEVGTGKTTLCRCLLDQVPAGTDIAFLLNPKVTVEELLVTICEELGIEVPAGHPGRKVMIDRINRYLLDNHARGRKAVLVIDEAQNLGAEVLEQLRLLTNLETSERKLLQILLLGQPELKEKLARPELRQLAQRITARYHLGPLAREEIGGYVAHRLAMAGGRANIRLFPPSVLKTLHRLSRGIPRLINIICDRALLGVYAEGKDRVDRRIVRIAAGEVSGDEGSLLFGPAVIRRWRFGSGIAMVALMSLVLWQIRISSFSPPIEISPAGSILELGAADPAEVMDPAGEVSKPAHLGDLPEAELPVQSREAALGGLFAQWGVSYDPAENGEGCGFAASLGLQCLERQDGWEALLGFNLPAALKMVEPERTYFSTLTKVSGDQVVMGAGDQARKVSIHELAGRWQGEYLLLWRPPPAYQGAIKAGAREPLVSWLGEQLAMFDRQEPAAAGHVFDEQMVRRVKAFQFSSGLVPDGIVGPQTLIRLCRASGSRTPRLVPGDEEI